MSDDDSKILQVHIDMADGSSFTGRLEHIDNPEILKCVEALSQKMKINSDRQSIAYNLRRIRKEEQGMSISELSKHTGILRTVLSRYECGDEIPTSSHLLILRDALNLRTINPFFGRGDYGKGDRVRYVPLHTEGDPGHSDCENGVVTSVNCIAVFVLFDSGGNPKGCNPEDLLLLDGEG